MNKYDQIWPMALNWHSVYGSSQARGSTLLHSEGLGFKSRLGHWIF
jgi:hypothetical protein